MNRRSILDDGKGNIVMDDAMEFTPELLERARINAELDAAAAAMNTPYKHVLDGPKDWSWLDAAEAKRKAAKKKAKATPKSSKPRRTGNAQ
jgi:hypothetical protein